MKKFLLYFAALLMSALLYAHPDEPTTSNPDHVMWHTVTVIDYKPGTEDTARELIQKFESASEKAGISHPVIYWLESGKYDLVVTWKLKEGPADLEGRWSPTGDSWWKALVAQEGSEEAAQKLQDRYNELIASSYTNVARKAN